MALDTARVRQQLRGFNLRDLFIEELGWDRYPSAPIHVTTDQKSYELRPVAHKRGMAVFACEPADGRLPDSATRRLIDKQIAKAAHEHIIIYLDRAAASRSGSGSGVSRASRSPAARRRTVPG